MVLHEVKNDHWDSSRCLSGAGASHGGDFLPMEMLALTLLDSGDVYTDVYDHTASNASSVPFFALGDSYDEDEDNDFGDMDEDDEGYEEEEDFDDDEEEVFEDENSDDDDEDDDDDDFTDDDDDDYFDDDDKDFDYDEE